MAEQIGNTSSSSSFHFDEGSSHTQDVTSHDISYVRGCSHFPHAQPFLPKADVNLVSGGVSLIKPLGIPRKKMDAMGHKWCLFVKANAERSVEVMEKRWSRLVVISSR